MVQERNSSPEESQRVSGSVFYVKIKPSNDKTSHCSVTNR